MNYRRYIRSLIVKLLYFANKVLFHFSLLIKVKRIVNLFHIVNKLFPIFEFVYN